MYTKRHRGQSAASPLHTPGRGETTPRDEQGREANRGQRHGRSEDRGRDEEDTRPGHSGGRGRHVEDARSGRSGGRERGGVEDTRSGRSGGRGRGEEDARPGRSGSGGRVTNTRLSRIASAHHLPRYGGHGVQTEHSGRETMG
jgi:hypothetical protein